MLEAIIIRRDPDLGAVVGFIAIFLFLANWNNDWAVYLFMGGLFWFFPLMLVSSLLIIAFSYLIHDVLKIYAISPLAFYGTMIASGYAISCFMVAFVRHNLLENSEEDQSTPELSEWHRYGHYYTLCFVAVAGGFYFIHEQYGISPTRASDWVFYGVVYAIAVYLCIKSIRRSFTAYTVSATTLTATVLSISFGIIQAF